MRLNKMLITILLVLFCISLSQAQNRDTLWTTTFPGKTADAVCFLSDNSIVIAGEVSDSLGNDGHDLLIIKADISGNLVWADSFGSNYDELSNDVLQLNDSGILTFGSTSSPAFSNGSYDMLLINMDTNGNQIWHRNYGEAGRDIGLGMTFSSDGNLLLAGFTESFNSGNRDFYLLKINSQGDTLWTRAYGSSLQEIAVTMKECCDGGYVLTGNKEVNLIHEAIVLTKLNENGDSLWTNTYQSSTHETSTSLVEMENGGFLIAGISALLNTGFRNLHLIRTNSNGTETWSQVYEDIIIGGRPKIHSNSEGHIYITCSRLNEESLYEVFIMKMNDDLETLWTESFSSDNHNIFINDSDMNDSGEIILAGTIQSLNYQDLFLAKFCEDMSNIDPRNNPSTPNQFNITSVYPNPFNPSTTIHLSLPETSIIEVKVYDISGRLVERLANGILPAGEHNLNFNAFNLSSGIYYVQAINRGVIETQKILLIK